MVPFHPAASGIQRAARLVQDRESPGAEEFFRAYDRKAPHNAYISGAGIIDASNKLGYSLYTREEYYNEKQFCFAETLNTLEQYESAIVAKKISLAEIFPYSKTAFVYNENDGLYYKSIHNLPQIDGLDRTQLSFANLIIQNTKWCYMPDNKYLYFQIIDNTEDGYFFTKGKCIHITWEKAADHLPTRYFDDYGNEIELNEGKTYIAIAQKGKNPVIIE